MPSPFFFWKVAMRMWNDETKEYVIEINMDNYPTPLHAMSEIQMAVRFIVVESAYSNTHCLTINHLRMGLSQPIIYSELELSIGYKRQLTPEDVHMEFDLENHKIFVKLRNLKDLRQYRSTVKLEEVFGVAE